MDVVVAGSHGLIGSALVPALREHGHRVRRLVRRAPTGADEIGWDPDHGRLEADALVGVDAVVNLAGAGIGDRRLTASYRRTVLSSRTRTTGLLAATLAGMADGPRVLIQGSAVGAYGERGEEVLREDEPYGGTVVAGIVRQWELAARDAQDAGVRVTYLRTGIVLAAHGGALARLLPLIRLGVGGPLGSGRQWWSWITLADEVAAIEHLLGADVSGPVNIVAEPARNAEVVKALAAAMHRPAVLRVPTWALRAALGEFSQEIVGSVRAVPDTLVASGFVHEYPRITEAAGTLVG